MLGSHGNPSRCGFRQPLPCLLLAIFFCLCPALLPGLFLPPSLLPVPAARACIPLPWCFPLLVSWYPLAPGAPVVSFIAACMITAPGRPPGGICRAYLQLLVYSPPGAHLLSCFASGVGRVAPFMLALQHLCWPPASCLLSVSVPWRSHSSPSSDRCLSLSRCPAVSTACMLSACCIFRTPVQAPASLRSCSSHSQACCLFTLECHRPYPHTYPCMRHPRACLACVIPCL